MRGTLFVVAIFLAGQLPGQTPYLNIELKMDRYMTETAKYRISMKICDPLKTTERGDWMTKDTSAIDYLSLKPADFTCGEYYYIEGRDDYAGAMETKFNLYQYANHVFAWEKVLVFRIANYSSRGWTPEMYVVLPMKYKAFVTNIELTDLVFESGKLIYLSDPVASYSKEGNDLLIQQSLKNEQLIKEDKFSLRDILPKRY